MAYKLPSLVPIGYEPTKNCMVYGCALISGAEASAYSCIPNLPPRTLIGNRGRPVNTVLSYLWRSKLIVEHGHL